MNSAVLVARVERGVELGLARRLSCRGWRVRLLAFQLVRCGGATLDRAGWVRLISRALLTDTPGPEAELVRGWHRFMTIRLFFTVRLPVGMPPVLGRPRRG